MWKLMLRFRYVKIIIDCMFQKGGEMYKVFTWMVVILTLGLQSCGTAPEAPRSVEPERPNVYYIHENQLVLQQPGQQPEILLVLPDLGQVKDALQVEKNIFILRERGLQKVSLVNKTVDLVEQFPDITVNGALFAAVGQQLLIYAVDNKVELYFLSKSTVREVLSQTGFFVPFGLLKDGTELYLVPRAGDPEFPEIWVLALDDGETKPFPTGIGTEASLSPNGQFLAIASTHFLEMGNPREYRLTLFDLTSPEVPGRILSLPNAPSHSYGRLIWSPNGQELYFMLRSGKPSDESETSYGLWRLVVGSETFSPVANVEDPALHFVSLSPDGEWAILIHETKPYVTIVHVNSGEINTIELPAGQVAIVRHQIMSTP